MKKLCIIVISLLLCLNLTACFDTQEKITDKSSINITTNSKSSQNNNQKSNVLTIACFLNNGFLQTASKRFQEINPDIKIEIKEYGHAIENKVDLGNGGTLTSVNVKPEEFQKYRYTINTELMSGKAPDIISIEELPYKEYIDSGMLANMSPLMEDDSDFNVKDYNTKIFDLLHYNDGLYVVPMSYSLNLITGNYNLESQHGINNKIDGSSWNWQDFFAAAQKALKNSGTSGKPEYIFSVTQDTLFEEMFLSIYEDIVNEKEKTAGFISEDFIHTLEYCKSLSDNRLIYKNRKDLKRGKVIFDRYYVNSIYHMASEGSVSYVVDNTTRYFYKMPSNGSKSGVTFSAFDMYAVNNNSNNKDLAWKFIKFLLSDEMQSSPELVFLPVNNITFDKKIERESHQYISECEKFKEIPLEKAHKLLDNYTQQLKKFKSNVESYRYANPVILNIVKEHAEMFFSGQKSSKQVAEIIQNKVSTYLKEQR